MVNARNAHHAQTQTQLENGASQKITAPKIRKNVMMTKLLPT
jgi:hypothetical protein